LRMTPSVLIRKASKKKALAAPSDTAPHKYRMVCALHHHPPQQQYHQLATYLQTAIQDDTQGVS
jgi:hypothetical protein